MKTFLKVTCVVFLTSLACLALTLGVDQHLHGKFDSLGALNYRGYRGAVVGEKQQGEHRVGVFGGSVAMGYGIPTDQSIAGHLQLLLNQAGASRFTVINLAATGDAGLDSFATNYQHFDYLQLDTLVFLVYADDVVCRVDPTSAGDWQLFVDTLMEHHRALARHLFDSAGLRSSADALSADEDQRKRVFEAFAAALSSPDAVDSDRFADMEQKYRVDDDPTRISGNTNANRNVLLTCLANLLLLQATLGNTVEPITGVEQLAPSTRTSNLIFSRFNYWFILMEVGKEKYYLWRYGDIAEGYRTDPLERWSRRFQAQITRFRGTGDRPLGADLRPYTSTDFVSDMTRQGKRVYVLLYPFMDEPVAKTAQKMYFDYQLKENDAVRVIDLSSVFRQRAWDSNFSDGLHFSSLGSQVTAEVLYESMRRDVLAQ